MNQESCVHLPNRSGHVRGSWAQGLTDDDVRGIYSTYRRGDGGPEFDEAFADAFGGSAPEILNTSQQLTVVASEMDDATERLVTYLATGYGVPINVMFFDYYEDDGRCCLARTWMPDQSSVAAASSPSGTAVRKQHPWNGQDWYVSFGEGATPRGGRGDIIGVRPFHDVVSRVEREPSAREVVGERQGVRPLPAARADR